MPPSKASKVSVTYLGDPADGFNKVTGYRVIKRWDDNAEEEVVIMKPIIRRHKAEDPEVISLYGLTFERGKPVEIDAESEFWKTYGAKFTGNNHFDVQGVEINYRPNYAKEPRADMPHQPEADKPLSTKAAAE